MRKPLAYRVRPRQLSDIVGQTHMIGPGKLLTKMIEHQTIFSMILFGPPGNGKTTIANVLAAELQLPYRYFNAVIGNKKDLTTIFAESDYYETMLLFIDEVHRLNKDKQDLLLPYLESGKIILIGATTSNPFFSINPAIRSRCQLVEVKRLTAGELIIVLKHAMDHADGLQGQYQIEEAVLQKIAAMANGDVRFALTVLDVLATTCSDFRINYEFFAETIQYANLSMDHDGDEYYDTLSGFQKAIRGSDADAAIYYLAKLLQANDLDSIERRLLVIAYEDIGLGNPAAVARTIQAIDAAKRVGMPEAMIPLANAVIDLALSPKSQSACSAIHAAMEEIQQRAHETPQYLRLNPVSLAEDDKYDYDLAASWPLIQYLPDAIKHKQFYIPKESGSYEKALASNYHNLKKQPRTNQLAALKRHLAKR